MAKTRFADRRTERFSAAFSVASNREKSLPPEIREAHLAGCREDRINELRRQYLNGTYHVPAGEVSAALIEKHLKR